METAREKSRAVTSTETPLDHSPPPADASHRAPFNSAITLEDDIECEGFEPRLSRVSNRALFTAATPRHRDGAIDFASSLAVAVALASTSKRTARAPPSGGVQGSDNAHSPVKKDSFASVVFGGAFGSAQAAETWKSSSESRFSVNNQNCQNN